MPATRINPVRILQTGVVEPVAVAADTVNGNIVTNADGLQLTVNNTGGTPVTVTLKTSATVEGQAVADLTVTVAAGTAKRLGSFSRALFGEDVEFSVSGACTLAAYR